MIKICKNGHEFEDDDKRSPFCPNCRSMMGRRSKRKGSANELRFSKYLQSQFDKYGLKYRARRTPRSGAIHEFEPADIMFSGSANSIFNRLHLENKNTAQWLIEEWYSDALTKERDTGKNREPVLVVRKPNKSEEYAIVSMEFLVKLLIDIDLLKKDD